MPDFNIDYSALQAKSQRCTAYRARFDEEGTATENELNQAASTALVNEASDSLRQVGTRFSRAFKDTGVTLDRYARFLDQMKSDYVADGNQSRAGFDGINPG